MRNFKYILSLWMIFQIFNYAQGLQIPDKDDWQRVYLATYPRCGNHWLRNLLEEATHITTSSVYLDKEPMHLKKPFPWGGYASKHGYEGNCSYPKQGEIVVIKTHFPAKPKTQFDLQPSVKIIRIVRHPVDSFYSHFVHSGNELPEDNKIPSGYVKKSINNWKKFEKYWNHQPNVLTIRYEDILHNTEFYFRQIIEAIGYHLNNENISRAIAKFPPQGTILKHIEHFYPEDLNLISNSLEPLMKKYGYDVYN